MLWYKLVRESCVWFVEGSTCKEVAASQVIPLIRAVSGESVTIEAEPLVYRPRRLLDLRSDLSAPLR